MTVTNLRVKVLRQPIIRAKFIPWLPATIVGRTGISVERDGLNYLLDLDYSKFFELNAFTPADKLIAVQGRDGIWNTTSIETLRHQIGADNPNLVAISGAATATDKLGWWSDTAQYSLTDFTAYMRSLLDDPDASTARATLGLVIGTDVQPHDAELDALAGLVSAADKLPYFTGPGAAALTGLTSYARSLLDDADAATARATLGLVIGTDVQAHDSDLDAIAALTPADNDFIQRKAGAWVNRSIAQVKTDLAISNVDNTSDLNKPISTATQGALDLKADKSTTLSAGTGLTGGGDFSANRTIALDSASIASLGKADTAVQPSDLATVATTGAYSDLTGKPYTVPAGGVTGQVLAKKTSTDGDTEWITGGGGGGGSGDVTGPSGATDGNIVTFDGATGKLVKDSGTSVTDLTGAIDYLLNPPAAKTQLPTMLPLWSAGYTKIGNMTQGVGLNALFDLDIANTGRREATTGFCGIDFGAPIALMKWEVQAAANGFDGSGSANTGCSISLYGSNTAFTNGNEGTLLSTTGSFTDPNAYATVSLAADPATAYRYYSVYFSTPAWCMASMVRAYRTPDPVEIDCPKLTIVRSSPGDIIFNQAATEVPSFRTRFEVVEAGSIDVALRMEARHIGNLVSPTYTGALGIASRVYYRYSLLESGIESEAFATFNNSVSGQNILSATDHYGLMAPTMSLDVVPGFYEVTVFSSAHTDGDARDGLACLNGGSTAYNELRISYTQGGIVVRS